MNDTLRRKRMAWVAAVVTDTEVTAPAVSENEPH